MADSLNTTAGERRLSVASHVLWSVEEGGIRIVTGDPKKGLWLAYPRAAIWELMARKNSYESIVSKVSSIGSISVEAAGRLVRQSVQEWVERGYLMEV